MAASPGASGGVGELPEFYMRPLKEPCVSYLSEEGKARLIRALTAGTAECFLPLSAQFRTQDEPAFCGLSTMVMCLNALQIDPRRRWKGSSVWRWFEESMLSCCEPIEAVRESGISLDSLACLARCQGAGAEVRRPAPPAADEGDDACAGATGGSPKCAGKPGCPKAPSGAMSVAEFRSMAEAAGRSTASVLVTSFNRRALNQTGGGHFSPIAAFDAATDSVLVLDVARFKLPPFWVSVAALHRAMQDLDSATGAPRGCLRMWRLACAPLIVSTVEDLVLKTPRRQSSPAAEAPEAAAPAASPAPAAAGETDGSARATAGSSARRGCCSAASQSAMSCVAPTLVSVMQTLLADATAALPSPASSLAASSPRPDSALVAPPSDGCASAAEAMAAVPERFVRAYIRAIGPEAASSRCLKRVSGAQVADARALLAELEAWPPFEQVQRLFVAGHAPASGAADLCGDADSFGCGSCVKVKREHAASLLLATLAAAAHRVAAAGDEALADACPSCTAATAMGLTAAPAQAALPGLATFTAVSLPGTGTSLLREATMLSEQLLALASPP
ncbi:hypothetical protein FNF28_00692 [Cafeteria roenbergensis]|uniref:glutathione gamma-glutamylcysteinyltransferase n=1 Tax=Cafeteria roenbergensis TaxID=33653 RepID=A0A5A8E5Y3_CAFRO|nr:hypothetical protein FNF28_00692 [Cafeteria roenbergensis]